MKKLLLITIIGSSSLFSSTLSSSEIVDMVAKIKKERVGISLLKLEGTSNPFLVKEKTKEKVAEEVEEKKIVIPEVVYQVDAILNHAAFINKKWYKLGDKLGNYTVGYVAQNSVTLKSKMGNKTLSLKKKKKNFIKLKEGNR